MTGLLVRGAAPDDTGLMLSVTPAGAGWDHVGFAAVRMAPGQVRQGGEAGREQCIVVLSGMIDVMTPQGAFAGLGGRADVFAGPGDALYLPAGLGFAVTARDLTEIAICSAPGWTARPPRRIARDTIACETRGEGTNTRHVRNVLPETGEADSLLVVEVITPGGHWSSYPSHKHDSDAFPAETRLEETYYHRLSPPDGFAFQRVYTDSRDIDATMAVHDGDCVLVPRGYHPVAAPPDHTLWYLNVMAGPVRHWRFTPEKPLRKQD